VPKTLTGAELELDDAPARDCDLFLVDGNNLAYRAFFALPEELATSDGFPTNALLGFTNMLFKLLSDYRPKGVAVAWDTRPVHRHAQAAEGDVVYKADRRPMADLLAEQFPHFRPIVEAFGYRNLEFEGWEADDVIATLATRADEAGIKTTVVSTDRDAFQLVTERVALMMTPRGVSDVHVYTPDRVEARYGIRPLQIPDFIGLKGDTSDNIPGIPGIGDKTAGQLIAQYGSVEEVIAHADELSPRGGRTSPSSPTRRGSRRSSRRCGATSRSTAIPPTSCSARPTARSCARCSGASSSATSSTASTSSTRRCRRASASSPGRRCRGGRARCRT
jgi:DNA polymerase-1